MSLQTLFINLLTAFNYDATSETVDRLASHFSCTVGAYIYTNRCSQIPLTCVECSAVSRLVNLSLFLSSYGVVLHVTTSRQHSHAQIAVQLDGRSVTTSDAMGAGHSW
jgi:hypothetical protein